MRVWGSLEYLELVEIKVWKLRQRNGTRGIAGSRGRGGRARPGIAEWAGVGSSKSLWGTELT